MKQIKHIVFLSLFVWGSTVAQPTVYVWANKQLDSTQNTVTFAIHTSGFANAKAFGCEVFFDTLTLTQDVVNKMIISFHSLPASAARIKYKQHSIRFFFLSKKNAPLLSTSAGSMLSIVMPLGVPRVENIYPTLAPWKVGLINELYQQISICYTYPIVDFDDKNDKKNFFSSYLFPNPSQGLFHLKFTNFTIHDVIFTLYDILGREIISSMQPFAVNENYMSFNYPHLPNGFYFVRAQYFDSLGRLQTFTWKLLKIK
ncbi:MAG: T9SS type A sorting domain-containing protein [Stygiobacter sp.]